MMKNTTYAFLLWSALGCSRSPSEPIGAAPDSRKESVPAAAQRPSQGDPTSGVVTQTGGFGIAGTATTSTTAAQAAPASSEIVSSGGADPLAGKWTLADATKSMPGKDPLVATITTNKGAISCRLLDTKAPNTVANFIGLAHGIRPWAMPASRTSFHAANASPARTWVKRPAYDGTTFHRIIKGFMIQGGDAAGNGSGEPGYAVADEIWEGAKHSREGLLCMANRGPNTNGAQFFITDAAAAHLDGGYTIFGECEPSSLIHEIANVPVNGEKPVSPVVIESVRVKREAPVKK